jgi:hypothetical protein
MPEQQYDIVVFGASGFDFDAFARTFCNFSIVRPATAHVRPASSSAMRATSSATNCPVKPEAFEFTKLLINKIR